MKRVWQLVTCVPTRGRLRIKADLQHPSNDGAPALRLPDIPPSAPPSVTLVPTLTAKTWAFSSEAALLEEREGRQKSSAQLSPRLFVPRACALPRAKEMEREAQRSGGIFLRSHSKGEMRWFHPVTRHSVPTLWPCGDLRASIICPSGLAPNVYGQDKGFWNHLTFPSLALRPNLSPLTLSPTPVFPANLSSSVSASAYLSPIFPSLSGPPNAPGIRTQKLRSESPPLSSN